LRHDVEAVQLGLVIRGITFVSSLELTNLSFMLVQNPVPEMPAIPLSFPFMTFSHVPRSFMSSSAQSPTSPPQRQAIVNKRSVGIFCWNLLRANTLLPSRGFSSSHLYGGSGNSVSRSWDHFLVDERRFTGAKDGIWSSVVVGFGLAYLRSWTV
jgi:hypothetical protein